MMLTQEADNRPAIIDLPEAPPLVGGDPAIDTAHLALITHGEPETEREMLRVFDLQADLLLARMSSEEPKAAAAYAHTLAVSARSLGAFKVAQAAAAIEQITSQPGPVVLTSAMTRLSRAVIDVQDAIASRLG